MNRIEIINNLIQKNKYKSYLEIGVQGGSCFTQINCDKRVGVDPDKTSAATVHLTSDDYFKESDEKFDIIFIDGLHESPTVIRDIENSLNHLNDGGTIVMHDCLPTSKRMQEIPLEEQNEWTGDVWKAFLEYRANPELEMCVVNCDWGCGIIRKGTQIPLKFDVLPTYEEFTQYKMYWMNVISPDQFKQNYL
jgi:predicted O-methyltransferase YrrM